MTYNLFGNAGQNYNFGMFEAALIPDKTIITANGDSAAIDISGAENRVFLLTLNVTDVLEQESIEIEIRGSADGQTWPANVILTFPQQFYRGQTPLLLDLSDMPDVKYIRAHWQVNRWGRGGTDVRFEIGLAVREVPQEMVAGKARTRMVANSQD